jgi:hypothetical protein
MLTPAIKLTYSSSFCPACFFPVKLSGTPNYLTFPSI